MNYLFILAGFTLLIMGGNWLLKAAVSLSLRLKIPKIVIGMTVVSFATSMPELIVSLKAAMHGHADIALGNVIGSNIANLGFVLAIVIMVSTIKVEKSFYITDWPVMMLSSVLLYVFLAFDGQIQRWEGFVMFITLVLILIYLFKYQKVAVIDEMPEDDVEYPLYKSLFFLVLGGVGLWAGSGLLIKGSVNLATEFGVSERIIGITIISIGTSIPELAASLVAIMRKEKAISLGNLLGSNMFNILAVLGITSMVTPISANDQGLIDFDLIWMLVLSLSIFPLVFTPGRMRLSWGEGLILLGSYVIFISMVV
ncbi:calcium/sodium antiporter [Lutimonas halocynthiae]|uniref:calcium/sodium antiporter n=1 Tax=Lutimonas halocynthiae TaxID=1446477 RepID=UPI0025B52382|nr:calcium/sodium antiporter [Lutimonas halocynthiae]MDN3641860.1 calcium/sodium antiporter [Lutimonas halocynthiae]